MDRKIGEKLVNFFKEYTQIKLVYLFGSQASGNAGPLSDYDLAVYLDNKKDSKEMAELRMELIGKVSLVLETDRVDVVVINILKEPELKYNIISEGEIIFERDNARVEVEPRIMTEYADFKKHLSLFNK